MLRDALHSAATLLRQLWPALAFLLVTLAVVAIVFLPVALVIGLGLGTRDPEGLRLFVTAALVPAALGVIYGLLRLGQRFDTRMKEQLTSATSRLGLEELEPLQVRKFEEMLRGRLAVDEGGRVLRAFRGRREGGAVVVAEWLQGHQFGPNDLENPDLHVVDVPHLHSRPVLVVAHLSNERSLPRFRLFPEAWHVKLAEALAWPASGRRTLGPADDIDFDRDPEWSRRWFLCGPNRRAIRMLFVRRLRDVFRKVGGWRVTGSGRWLVLSRGRAVAPSRLGAHLREAMLLVRRMNGALTSA